MAWSPVSPVRMRMTSSSGLTKILVFSTAIQFGMAFLAAKTHDLGDREAPNALLAERFAYVIKLERLDDRCDQFHKWLLIDARKGISP
jgi:hypothetical protein